MVMLGFTPATYGIDKIFGIYFKFLKGNSLCRGGPLWPPWADTVICPYDYKLKA